MEFQLPENEKNILAFFFVHIKTVKLINFIQLESAIIWKRLEAEENQKI
jgi:hypothetical protein